MIVLSDLVFLLAPPVLGLGVPALSGAQYKKDSCKMYTSPLQPPGWVFGVGWLILYLLYGIAFFLAWRQSKRRMTPALWVSAALFVGLVTWSVVFFRFCAPELAFASIMALLGLAFAMALLFARENKMWSAILSVPLVLWMCFASYLSFETTKPFL